MVVSYMKVKKIVVKLSFITIFFVPNLKMIEGAIVYQKGPVLVFPIV